MRMITVIVSALLMPMAAHSQELWHGATYGQSTGQIEKIFPGAHADPKKPNQLVLPSVPVADTDGEAHFVFHDGLLANVNIELKTDNSFFGANADLVDRLKTLISSKYGAPYHCTGSPDRTITVIGCTWLTSKLEISLFYMDQDGGKTSTLAVTYAPKKASTDSNL